MLPRLYNSEIAFHLTHAGAGRNGRNSKQDNRVLVTKRSISKLETKPPGLLIGSAGGYPREDDEGDDCQSRSPLGVVWRRDEGLEGSQFHWLEAKIQR